MANAAGYHDGVQGAGRSDCPESGKSWAASRGTGSDGDGAAELGTAAEIDAGRGAPGALTTEERRSSGGCGARIGRCGWTRHS